MSNKFKEAAMDSNKNICTACNYIYDSKLIGTPFEQLPEDWRCPDCGQSKDMFQPCSCVSVDSHTCLIGDRTVGELVAEHPPRANVFVALGIDYCCGGKKKLTQAAKDKGIPLSTLIEKLAVVDANQKSSEKDWTKSTLRELIEHIVCAYHEPLREQFPQVQQLADKVARVHGESHPEMIKVASIFRTFTDELQLHMEKEEMVLFPGIAKMEAAGSQISFGCGGGIEHPIAVMMADHETAGSVLAVLSELTNDFTPPEDACNSFRVLLHLLKEIEVSMHEHVHKENNILFPRAMGIGTKTPVAK